MHLLLSPLLLLVLLIFFFAIPLVPIVSAVRPASATSPSVCLSNGDCPAGSTCDTTDDFNYPATYACTPFVKPGAKCFNKLTCTAGHFCGADSQFALRSEYTCRPYLPLGSTCFVNNACIGHSMNASCLVADPDMPYGRRKCTADAKAMPAQPGESCERFERVCGNGLYCSSPWSKGVCRRKKWGGGRTCGTLGEEECRSDSCVSVWFKNFKRVCAPMKRTGQLCSNGKMCEGYSSGESVCNIPRGSTGKCMKITSLLTRPGMKCKPGYDRCDSRRGLSCRYAGKSLGFRCAHRAFPGDVGLPEKYCSSTVGKTNPMLSTCNPQNGVPTECRPGKFFDECQPRAQKMVAQGEVCTDADLKSQCAPGLYCRSSDSVRTQRFGTELVQYCTKIVENGMKCDTFNTSCRFPLQCTNGICAEQTRSTSLAEDYAQVGKEYNGFNYGCDPSGKDDRYGMCAPGLTCRENSEKQFECLKPLVTVKKGKPCFSTAAFDKVCFFALFFIFFFRYPPHVCIPIFVSLYAT